MRPVDLARAAGLSTQQVRNLEAAGALPEADRTDSGYRQYDERHLAALLAYRALTPGLGPVGARSVLAAAGAGDVAGALALLDAGHAAVDAGRRGVAEIGVALTGLAAETTRSDRPDRLLSVGDLARLLGIRPSALRVWESAGLLTPPRDPGTGYRRYRPTDVRDARVVQTLRQGHYLFDRIRPIVEGLRRSGGTAELQAALTERTAMLDRQSLALLTGSARLWDYLVVLGHPT